MALTLTITNAGRAALVNAANTGTAPVVIAQVGLSGTAITPSPTATTLPGEFKRIATLSGDVVADDTIHLIVRDESGDVFTVRSLAMYLGDGTLFGLYGQAPVLVEKSAQAIMLVTVDVKFEDIAASAISFGNANFLNPPATTETQGVVELATSAETMTAADVQRAVTPKAFGDALVQALNNRFGINNALVWNPANDGAGSTLDSDLLDGQHGSYYANITARLGYTPVNKGGDIMSGPLNFTNGGVVLSSVHTAEKHIEFQRPGQLAYLYGNVNGVGLHDSQYGGIWAWNYGGQFLIQGGVAWHSANDGAGSGLDADLLDGQDSSYFTNIPARLGFTPIQQGGGAGQGNNKIYMGWSASSRLRLQVDTTDLGYITTDAVLNNASLPINGASVSRYGLALWGPDNDGAGSGLDADLLDGQDSGYYTNITARLGFTPVNKNGDTTGRLVFAGNVTGNSGIATATGGLGENEVRGNGTGAAMLCFHRPGSYATYLGIDTDNVMKIGGWSVGANAFALWHSGNDGAGSGLDADLLDGQHGSYYTDITARLGYTPVNRGGDNIYGRLTFIGADIAFSSVHTGERHIEFARSGQTAYFFGNGAGVGLYDSQYGSVWGWTYGSPFMIQGGVAWHSANDGSGSGSDSDMLDGHHASEFVFQSDGSKYGSNANGYWELRPNGMIEQWGTVMGSFGEGPVAHNFPIPFTDLASISIQVTEINPTGSVSNDMWCQRGSKSLTSFQAVFQSHTSGNSASGFEWRAIGR